MEQIRLELLICIILQIRTNVNALQNSQLHPPYINVDQVILQDEYVFQNVSDIDGFDLFETTSRDVILGQDIRGISIKCSAEYPVYWDTDEELLEVSLSTFYHSKWCKISDLFSNTAVKTSHVLFLDRPYNIYRPRCTEQSLHCNFTVLVDAFNNQWILLLSLCQEEKSLCEEVYFCRRWKLMNSYISVSEVILFETVGHSVFSNLLVARWEDGECPNQWKRPDCPAL